MTATEPPRLRLGDAVESALSAVGITSDRVSRWLGEPCGCKERKAKFNAFGRWIASIATATAEQARASFNALTRSKS